MTAVSLPAPAEALRWRLGRLLAHVAVAVLVALFAAGVVLWATDGHDSGGLWALPDGWTRSRLAGVLDGVPLEWVLTYFLALELVVATAGVVAAVLVLRGATSVFRLYLGVELALFGTMSGAIPTMYDEVVGGVLGDLLTLLQGLAWIALFPLAYVFPDGRFVPRWSRWCAVAWVAYLPLTAAIELAGGGDPDSLAQTLPLLVLYGTAAYAAVHRYRKVADPDQRRQLRGVVTALVLWMALAAVLFATPLGGLVREVSGRGLAAYSLMTLASYLIVALVPAAVALAVLRYRLYDVDVWVNRALVYGSLTAIVATCYGLLTALGGLLWGSGSAVAATVVLAIAFHPLRLRVQRGVDRFVYGRRREPYAVLTELGRRLEAVVPPDELLAQLVAGVSASLRLAYVAASAGSASAVHPPGATLPTGEIARFPLRWHEQVLGELVVVVARGDDLGAADRDLLDGLARQAGAAVRAATLNDDLRRSRERILLAREDERSRLQRDLHDGLGPTLASLYQRVDAARLLLLSDPATAAGLLADVGDQTRAVIGDIRLLVNELRPPLLDEVGLVGALDAVARRLALPVGIDAGGLTTLTPVAEMAAYRIASEALTNAARHASAARATVTLRVASGTLVVTVADDGRGLPDGSTPGTGIRSMRERADELGGSCRIDSDSRGTRVTAVLPLGVDR